LQRTQLPHRRRCRGSQLTWSSFDGGRPFVRAAGGSVRSAWSAETQPRVRESRSLESVSVRRKQLQKSSSGDLGPEKRRFVVSRESAGLRGGGDGGLVRGNPSGIAAEEPRMKWRRRSDRRGSTRDHGRDRGSSRSVAWDPRRGKAPRVVPPASPSREGGSQRPRRARRKRPLINGAWSAGSDRGARGTAGREHAEETPRVNPERPPKRIARRETRVHRSPGLGCKPDRHGRGVSLEETPVTREVRVLVAKVEGEQTSVVCIEPLVRGAPQGKLQVAGASTKPSASPADTGGGGP